MTLGRAYAHIRNYPAAITQYSYWIDSRHSDDVNMAEARNARCRARALAAQALDQALDDCNFAVRREPKNAAFLDARGLVYLRKGQYSKAIADYDASLALVPKKAWALYGRGIAKQRLGQSAAGQADIAAATAISPQVAAEATGYGIAPGP